MYNYKNRVGCHAQLIVLPGVVSGHELLLVRSQADWFMSKNQTVYKGKQALSHGSTFHIKGFNAWEWNVSLYEV